MQAHIITHPLQATHAQQQAQVHKEQASKQPTSLLLSSFVWVLGWHTRRHTTDKQDDDTQITPHPTSHQPQHPINASSKILTRVHSCCADNSPHPSRCSPINRPCPFPPPSTLPCLKECQHVLKHELMSAAATAAATAVLLQECPWLVRRLHWQAVRYRRQAPCPVGAPANPQPPIHPFSRSLQLLRVSACLLPPPHWRSPRCTGTPQLSSAHRCGCLGAGSLQSTGTGTHTETDSNGEYQRMLPAPIPRYACRVGVCLHSCVLHAHPSSPPQRVPAL